MNFGVCFAFDKGQAGITAKVCLNREGPGRVKNSMPLRNLGGQNSEISSDKVPRSEKLGD